MPFFVVHYLKVPPQRHPIARQTGRGIKYLLYVKNLIHALLACCMLYHDIVDRILSAPDWMTKVNQYLKWFTRLIVIKGVLKGHYVHKERLTK